MRVAVIVNPIAGRGRPSSATGSERRDLVRAWLAAQAVDADVSLTTRGGHAAVLSRQFLAQGFDRIVAWGGDGTANEVAGPLIGSRAVFGLVAAGSGDGLARGLGVPRVPRLALEVAVHGRVVRRDVGRFGSRHFLNVAGIGFDAAVARAFGEHTIGGLRGYLRAGLHLVHSYEAATYELDFDGSRSAGPRFMIAFANGPEYGNGFVLAPGADPADGRLDVVELEGGLRGSPALEGAAPPAGAGTAGVRHRATSRAACHRLRHGAPRPRGRRSVRAVRTARRQG